MRHELYLRGEHPKIEKIAAFDRSIMGSSRNYAPFMLSCEAVREMSSNSRLK